MNTTCPICHSPAYAVIYKKVSLNPETDIVQCNNCTHLYSFFENEIDSKTFYNDEVYQVVENRQSVFDKILTIEYNKVVSQLTALQPQKGWLLDFGCGKGKFAHLAEQKGWHVKCVETSAERAKYASTVYGLDVNTSIYSSGKIFNAPFNSLALLHVLEHLPAPLALLTELIRENLADDAVVIIEVPNFYSYQSRIAKEKWMHLDVPRHLSHFTPERLESFTKDIGLTIVKKSFFSLHLGVLGMLDSLLKIMGYKGNIIYQLKKKKSFVLLLSIVLVLPFAFILESIASLSGKGGIIRYYLKRNK